jgi:hypothetical protein
VSDNPFQKYVERRERCRAYHVQSADKTIRELPMIFENCRWSKQDVDDERRFIITVVLYQGGPEICFSHGDFIVEEPWNMNYHFTVMGRHEFVEKFEPDE